jgi:hypothetical protein
MSYCRQGTDSDVYVLGTSYALQCCGCRLYRYSFDTRYFSRMLKHLATHRKVGHKVPTRAITRLRDEQRTFGNVYAKKDRNHTITKNVRKTKYELQEIELWKTMEVHRKRMALTAVKTFQSIFGRKPERLEMEGLAKTMDISLDLYFMPKHV